MDKKQISPTAGGATRREFIRTSATAVAAVAATGLLKTPVYGQDTAPSANVAGANNKIVVGYVGVGGQGMAHVRPQKQYAGENNIAQAAVCDVWQKRVNSAKDYIEKDNPNAKVDTYEDYRKMLERKDIDAICCATVDHWHTRVSVDANGPVKGWT